MSSRESPIERLDLRFLAEGDARRGFNLGMWAACTLFALAAAVGSWVLSRQMLRNELVGRLATSSNSADALLALESLIQLDQSKQVAYVHGLENENPAVVKATYRAIDSQITLWQIEGSSESVQHMHTLADRLASLSTKIPFENRMLASGLATRIFSYCYEKSDPQLQSLRDLCEQIVRNAAGSSTPSEMERRAASTLGTLVDSPSAPVKASRAAAPILDGQSSALVEPPPPLPQAMRMEDPPSSDETVNNLFSSERNSMRLTVSPRPVAAGLSMTVPDPNSRELEFPELESPGASSPQPYSTTGDDMEHFALNDDSSSGVMRSLSDPPQVALGSPALPVPPTPTVAKSIGDGGPNSLSLAAATELDALQDKTDQQVVRLLASIQPDVRKAATYALRVRGWPDSDIDLALELATASEAGRLQLIQDIASSRDDPRDWLLWMAEDGQPAVRKTAVALLYSMLDADVERRLRRMLGRENDQAVSETIRRVLIARAGPSNLR